MPDIHDPHPVLSAYPRLPAQTLIRTRDRTQTPLLLVPTPTHHPDPHVQGLALVPQTARGDAGGVSLLQIVVMADVEAQIDEDVTRVKICPTTGGDDRYHLAQGHLVDMLLFYITRLHFVS